MSKVGRRCLASNPVAPPQPIFAQFPRAYHRSERSSLHCHPNPTLRIVRRSQHRRRGPRRHFLRDSFSKSFVLINQVPRLPTALRPFFALAQRGRPFPEKYPYVAQAQSRLIRPFLVSALRRNPRKKNFGEKLLSRY